MSTVTRVFAGGVFAVICLTAINTCAREGAGPYLIGFGVNPQNTTPSYIRNNFTYMESRPFDGCAIKSNSGWIIMDGGAVSYTQIANEFAPLQGLQFKKLKHNLALVWVNQPADFFDDWSVVIQNFANLARVLKELGIEGIMFDNEPYKTNLWNYPDTCKYASTKSLQNYYDQARLRGKQVMEAMVAQYPDMTITFLHGPYLSYSGTPLSIRNPNVAWANELSSSFIVGAMEGMGSAALVSDGGELYGLRSVTDFQNSYQYRKYDFPKDMNVPFIPDYLRPLWPSKCTVDFGVYNGGGMTASVLKPTLINALTRCDRYAWFYVEGIDLFKAGSVPADWDQAIYEARAAVPYRDSNIPVAPSNLNASAVSTTQINLTWTDNSTTESGFTIERRTGTGSYALLANAGINATSYNDVTASAGNQYYYRVYATSANGNSGYSNEATVVTSSGPLPSPWQNSSIGSVGIAGSGGYSNGVFTVRGSGADIWGTADAFHFVNQAMNGDGQIVARVSSLQNTDAWAKAGLMIRQSLTAGSQNAMVTMTPSNGVSFQRRITAGGYSNFNQISTITIPEWLRLVRTGNSITASYSPDGNSWTVIGTDTISMTGTVYVGLAVTSHNNSVLTTATYDNVAVTLSTTVPAAPANCSATAMSSSQINLAWTDNSNNESGFKIERKNGSAGTYAQIGTVGTGVTSFADGGLTSSTQYFYRVKAASTAGDSSYSNEANATTLAAVTPLPSPWQKTDVGSVGLAGSATYNNGAFTIKGSGADIWGTADAFHYVYQPISADAQIVARVASLQNTDPWAKAGLMVRQSLTAGSQNAMVLVSASSGTSFQRRISAGGSSNYTPGPIASAPRWLKLVRTGNTLSGYQSADGSVWSLIGSDTITMSGTIYIGMAVTSHNNSTITTSVFDTVSVTTGSSGGGSGGSFSAKINFQPAGSSVPVGYIADTGAAYGSRGNGQTYGWNADISNYSRDRNAPNSLDQRYDTLNHMQKGSTPNAVWEIAVPNGSYTVRIVCGDPSFYDSVFRVAAEGTLTVSGTPTSTLRWIEGTKTVTVSDGRLTVTNASGAVNNKICFIDITSTTAPAAVLTDDSSSSVVKPLTVTALDIRSNYGSNTKSACSVTGTIKEQDLSADYKAAGATVTIDVAGAIIMFTLDASGIGTNQNGKLSLKYSSGKKQWVFKATLKGDTWRDAWDDAGLLERTTETQAINIPVTLTIDVTTFGGDRNLKYKNKLGTNGHAR